MNSTHGAFISFYKKTISVFSMLLLINVSVHGQGAKWSTAGNGISTGDFIGTTNNFPMIFRTNNTQKMVLGTNGILQLNNLSGTGNRLIQTDAAGNVISFPMGTSTQVLYGNGMWGTLPANYWTYNGNTLSGTEFIGSTNGQPLIFKTNNTQRMTINASGAIQVNSPGRQWKPIASDRRQRKCYSPKYGSFFTGALR